MAKRARTKAVQALTEPAKTVTTVRVGFVRSARVVWEKLPDAVKDKLRDKLRAAALNPTSAKPLVGPLAGCRRVTHGRVRCVFRIADGLAVIVVIAISKRKEGDRSDPYELAVAELRSGKSDIQEQFGRLVSEAIQELRNEANRRDR